MAWNDNWRSELESKNYLCYIRLCECRNTQKDIITMATLMYKYNKEKFNPEDCLIRMLEWVDMNGQWEIADLTQKQFNDALDIIRNV